MTKHRRRLTPDAQSRLCLPHSLLNDGWWLEAVPAAVPVIDVTQGALRPPSSQGKSMSLTSFRISRTPNARQWFRRRAVAAGILLAISDWLFYEADGIGLSLALFIALLGATAWAFSPAHVSRRRQIFALTVMAAGIMAIAEDYNPLSRAVGVFGLAAGALILATPADVVWTRYVKAIAFMPFTGPIWIAVDFMRVRKVNRRRLKEKRPFDWVGWTVPLLFGSVFLWLFAAANPLVENWFAAIDLNPDQVIFLLFHFIFLAIILCVIWPVLHVRAVRNRVRSKRELQEKPNYLAGLMSAPAVLRSLILFNVLFALQTIMDIGYLWGGRALPAGMTLAIYAHRGAYPLVITALLAAVFVLVALRRNGPLPSRWTHPLILAFVAQNILLVLSSILRLDLYVATYSLTWWRVAAFIWMGLVIFGLFSILVRIVSCKSNTWLAGVNTAALVATLYACCFVNMPDLIARYNLAHCFEVSGEGPKLDIMYMRSLGPGVIPALDDYSAQFVVINLYNGSPHGERLRDELIKCCKTRSQDWRAWDLAGWRLRKYLDNLETAAPARDE